MRRNRTRVGNRYKVYGIRYKGRVSLYTLYLFFYQRLPDKFYYKSGCCLAAINIAGYFVRAGGKSENRRGVALVRR